MSIRKFSELHLRTNAGDILLTCYSKGDDDMKVSSSIYKGIQYIQVSALPVEQRDRLLNTINTELLIKILVDGKVIGNCLQFKDYERWFENVYRPISAAEGLVTGRTTEAPAELVDLSAHSASR